MRDKVRKGSSELKIQSLRNKQLFEQNTEKASGEKMSIWNVIQRGLNKYDNIMDVATDALQAEVMDKAQVLADLCEKSRGCSSFVAASTELTENINQYGWGGATKLAFGDMNSELSRATRHWNPVSKTLVAGSMKTFEFGGVLTLGLVDYAWAIGSALVDDSNPLDAIYMAVALPIAGLFNQFATVYEGVVDLAKNGFGQLNGYQSVQYVTDILLNGAMFLMVTHSLARNLSQIKVPEIPGPPATMQLATPQGWMVAGSAMEAVAGVRAWGSKSMPILALPAQMSGKPRERLQEHTDEQIAEVLKKYNGNRKKAAEEIGTDSKNMRRRIDGAGETSPLLMYKEKKGVGGARIKFTDTEIADAIKQHGGHQANAAKALVISPETISRKIARSDAKAPLGVLKKNKGNGGPKTRYTDEQLAKALDTYGTQAGVAEVLDISQPGISKRISNAGPDSPLAVHQSRQQNWRARGSNISTAAIAGELKKSNGNKSAAARNLKCSAEIIRQRVLKEPSLKRFRKERPKPDWLPKF